MCLHCFVLVVVNGGGGDFVVIGGGGAEGKEGAEEGGGGRSTFKRFHTCNNAVWSKVRPGFLPLKITVSI